MEAYRTKSPVLFLIFNRPDLTKQVFEKICTVKPERLYVASDGPRPGIEKDLELIEESRNVLKKIDWQCEIKTLYRDRNLGCKTAVTEAINWFFENESEGIILEDDCDPSLSFFSFCDEMLHHYRNNNVIRHISGGNFQHGQVRGDGNYYFSNLTHVWGWASWRRAWKEYDNDLCKYNSEEATGLFSKVFSNPHIAQQWDKIFFEVKEKKIDTWDYQLSIINFFNQGLSVIPNKNLISNIGFRGDSTHTHEVSRYSNIPGEEIDKIVHPTLIMANKEADMYTMLIEYPPVQKKSTFAKIRNFIFMSSKRKINNK